MPTSKKRGGKKAHNQRVSKRNETVAKNAINSSIRELMHSAQEWPFALATQTQTLTVGTGTYSFPSNTSTVDWDSFYLKTNGYIMLIAMILLVTVSITSLLIWLALKM